MGPSTRVWTGLRDDFSVFRARYHPQRSLAQALAIFITHPTASALVLTRLAAELPRALALLARRRLLHSYGCDVGHGASIAGGFFYGHPTGVVIAGKALIEPEVLVFQHVTLGEHHGGYPVLRRGAMVLAGAVIVGAVEVGEGAVVGAQAIVMADVPAGATVPGGTRWTAAVAAEALRSG